MVGILKGCIMDEFALAAHVVVVVQSGKQGRLL